MKNKKIIRFFLFSALGLLFIFFLLLLSQNYQCPSCQVGESKNIKQVCFQKYCFEVEIADDDSERAQGLMDREKLDQNKGMLFIFDKEGIRGFWMKNTLIPLDIIWLNKNKEVVFIKKNAEPCGNSVCLPSIPPQKAQYVLEINAGLAEKMNLQISDKFLFKN